MNINYISHYGTKGMHWGERLYQYPDGRLTPLGKLRYGSKGNYGRGGNGRSRRTTRERLRYARNKNRPDPSTFHEDYRNAHDKSKKIYQMSNDELQTKIARLQLEKKYAELSPKPVSRGKAFVEQAMKLGKQGFDFAKAYKDFGKNLQGIQENLINNKEDNKEKERYKK